MDIEKMSEQELKALVYDQMVLVNQSQNNIKILEAEIAKRKKPTVVVPEKNEQKET